MLRPQTLKLLLLDGTPTGTWIAELDNWDGKALRVPRKQFAAAAKSRSELKHTGVYLLVGRADVAGERNRVYVGEAEELGKRILQPRTPEIEWTDALVFTRKSNELNKAHVKYLENILFDTTRGRQPSKRDRVFNKPKGPIGTLLRVEFSTVNIPKERLAGEPR